MTKSMKPRKRSLSKKISYHRAVITFESFGKVWTTIFCCQWNASKRTRILTKTIPKWIKRQDNSLAICFATIEDRKLLIRSFEPNSQITFKTLKCKFSSLRFWSKRPKSASPAPKRKELETNGQNNKKITNLNHKPIK